MRPRENRAGPPQLAVPARPPHRRLRRPDAPLSFVAVSNIQRSFAWTHNERSTYSVIAARGQIELYRPDQRLSFGVKEGLSYDRRGRPECLGRKPPRV